MNLKRVLSAIVLFASVMLFVVLSADAQETQKYKQIVEELSSKKFHGRGYVGRGALKAGKYIAKQFKAAGVDEVTVQPYYFDINTFPGKMELAVDGRALVPGDEFTLREFSCGVKGEYPLYFVDTLNFDSAKMFSDLHKPEYAGAFIVCDYWFMLRHSKEFKRLKGENTKETLPSGIIHTWKTPLQFYKAYGNKLAGPHILVIDTCIQGAKTVKVNIRNRYFSYKSTNIIAKVKGSRSDSCYVFTAHYDHLGHMGRKLYFPGANDNASGTAAIITLAEYYAKNKPEFDMYFIALSGEEANLLGSNHQVEHPSMPLESIKYLFNLDMIGDNNPVQYCEVSPSGMNGFNKMQQINSDMKLFDSLHLGELAANSDHWVYAQKGVPCILFENENGDAYKYYHTHHDDMSHFYTRTYDRLFKLITIFISNK